MTKKLWAYLGRILYWLSWPALFVYFKLNSKRTRVVLENGGQIVVVKPWLGSGKWTLPGGGLHSGEDPKAGAAREVIEETSIRLDPSALEPVMEESLKEDGFKLDCIAYSVSLPKAAEPVKQRFEILEVSWLSTEEALTRANVGSSTKAILASWKAKA